jgi:tight adherence protein B
MTDGILARDFRRVLSEANMGSSLDESLETLATERKNDDLTWLVTAILIQKNVGGSLSTIIDTVLETINARGEVRREIRALSAEGKLSAYVLIALPIFIFLFLTFTRRSYVEVLWKESLGQLILVVIGTLISIGWLWMRKVVNIKV